MMVSRSRMEIQGTPLDRHSSLLRFLQREEIHPKVRETLTLLKDYCPPPYNRSLGGATHKQLAFISNLTEISSDDDLLFEFLDTLRASGGIDSAQAAHLLDALTTPFVAVPEQGEHPQVFNPYNLPKKSALLLTSILEAGGDRRYVSKDHFTPIYNHKVSPSDSLNLGSLVRWLRGLDQRRGLVLWTRDALNLSGYRFGTVHARLTEDFLTFMEHNQVEIEDMTEVEECSAIM